MSNSINESTGLSKKQMLEKKKLLLQLRKDINVLEREIKFSGFINVKRCALRVIKIALKTGQLIAPYAVTAGITIGVFAIAGKTPFYRDGHKQNLKMMKELDGLGNIRYEQQYDNYENSKNTISYFSKWKVVDSDFYSREIEVYSIGDLTEEKIIEIVNNQGNIVSLKDVLGEPISKKTETKNNLSEEELQSESFLQAVFFSEISDDFIIIKESFVDNLTSTILWTLLTVFVELFPRAWRKSASEFDYHQCIEEIKRKYPAVDTDLLTKKLEIRRNNYDRLMR